MSVNRTRTARKPVGSGSVTRPIVEHSPSIGQMKASPYVNARSPSLTSPPRLAELASQRPSSADSLTSEEFFDTDGAPEYTQDHEEHASEHDHGSGHDSGHNSGHGVGHGFGHSFEHSSGHSFGHSSGHGSGGSGHGSGYASGYASEHLPHATEIPPLRRPEPTPSGKREPPSLNLSEHALRSTPDSSMHSDSPKSAGSSSSVTSNLRLPVKKSPKMPSSRFHPDSPFKKASDPALPKNCSPKDSVSRNSSLRNSSSKDSSPKDSSPKNPVSREPAPKEPAPQEPTKETPTETSKKTFPKESESNAPIPKESALKGPARKEPVPKEPMHKEPVYKELGHKEPLEHFPAKTADRKPVEKERAEEPLAPLAPHATPLSAVSSRNRNSFGSSTPSLDSHAAASTSSLDPGLPQSSQHSTQQLPQPSTRPPSRPSAEEPSQNYASWYDSGHGVEGLRYGSYDQHQTQGYTPQGYTPAGSAQSYAHDQYYPYQYQDAYPNAYHYAQDHYAQDSYSQAPYTQDAYSEPYHAPGHAASDHRQGQTAGYDPESYYAYDQFYDAYGQYYPYAAPQASSESLGGPYNSTVPNEYSQNYTPTSGTTEPLAHGHSRGNTITNIPSTATSTATSSATSKTTSSTSLPKSSDSISLDQDTESSKSRTPSNDSSSLSSVGITQSQWQPIRGGSLGSSTPSVNAVLTAANRAARHDPEYTTRGTPEPLHNLDNSGINGETVRSSPLARLTNHGSGSDLSPRSSVAPDSPVSVTTQNSQRPTSIGTNASETPSRTAPYSVRNAAGSGSSASLSRSSHDGLQGSPNSGTNSPTRAVSVRSAHTQGDSTLGTPQIPEENEKDAALGIGVGSAYVQRIRVDAGETYISRQPMVLPIGIRKKAKSAPVNVKPEFLRRAMDIRYTHLPQRMLETEFDDDDGDEDPKSGLSSTRPSVATSLESPRGSVADSHRSSSPVESIVEQTGKIKLFVANPDND